VFRTSSNEVSQARRSVSPGFDMLCAASYNLRSITWGASLWKKHSGVFNVA
jgi:hypothetical protein